MAKNAPPKFEMKGLIKLTKEGLEEFFTAYEFNQKLMGQVLDPRIKEAFNALPLTIWRTKDLSNQELEYDLTTTDISKVIENIKFRINASLAMKPPPLEDNAQPDPTIVLTTQAPPSPVLGQSSAQNILQPDPLNPQPTLASIASIPPPPAPPTIDDIKVKIEALIKNINDIEANAKHNLAYQSLTDQIKYLNDIAEFDMLLASLITMRTEINQGKLTDIPKIELEIQNIGQKFNISNKIEYGTAIVSTNTPNPQIVNVGPITQSAVSSLSPGVSSVASNSPAAIPQPVQVPMMKLADLDARIDEYEKQYNQSHAKNQLSSNQKLNLRSLALTAKSDNRFAEQEVEYNPNDGTKDADKFIEDIKNKIEEARKLPFSKVDLDAFNLDREAKLAKIQGLIQKIEAAKNIIQPHLLLASKEIPGETNAAKEIREKENGKLLDAIAKMDDQLSKLRAISAKVGPLKIEQKQDLIIIEPEMANATKDLQKADKIIRALQERKDVLDKIEEIATLLKDLRGDPNISLNTNIYQINNLVGRLEFNKRILEDYQNSINKYITGDIDSNAPNQEIDGIINAHATNKKKISDEVLKDKEAIKEIQDRVEKFKADQKATQDSIAVFSDIKATITALIYEIDLIRDNVVQYRKNDPSQNNPDYTNALSNLHKQNLALDSLLDNINSGKVKDVAVIRKKISEIEKQFNATKQGFEAPLAPPLDGSKPLAKDIGQGQIQGMQAPLLPPVPDFQNISKSAPMPPPPLDNTTQQYIQMQLRIGNLKHNYIETLNNVNLSKSNFDKLMGQIPKSFKDDFINNLGVTDRIAFKVNPKSFGKEIISAYLDHISRILQQAYVSKTFNPGLDFAPYISNYDRAIAPFEKDLSTIGYRNVGKDSQVRFVAVKDLLAEYGQKKGLQGETDYYTLKDMIDAVSKKYPNISDQGILVDFSKSTTDSVNENVRQLQRLENAFYSLEKAKAKNTTVVQKKVAAPDKSKSSAAPVGNTSPQPKVSNVSAKSVSTLNVQPQVATLAVAASPNMASPGNAPTPTFEDIKGRIVSLNNKIDLFRGNVVQYRRNDPSQDKPEYHKAIISLNRQNMFLKLWLDKIDSGEVKNVAELIQNISNIEDQFDKTKQEFEASLAPSLGGSNQVSAPVKSKSSVAPVNQDSQAQVLTPQAQASSVGAKQLNPPVPPVALNDEQLKKIESLRDDLSVFMRRVTAKMKAGANKYYKEALVKKQSNDSDLLNFNSNDQFRAKLDEWTKALDKISGSNFDSEYKVYYDKLNKNIEYFKSVIEVSENLAKDASKAQLQQGGMQQAKLQTADTSAAQQAVSDSVGQEGSKDTMYSVNPLHNINQNLDQIPAKGSQAEFDAIRAFLKDHITELNLELERVSKQIASYQGQELDPEDREKFKAFQDQLSNLDVLLNAIDGRIDEIDIKQASELDQFMDSISDIENYIKLIDEQFNESLIVENRETNPDISSAETPPSTITFNAPSKTAVVDKPVKAAGGVTDHEKEADEDLDSDSLQLESSPASTPVVERKVEPTSEKKVEPSVERKIEPIPTQLKSVGDEEFAAMSLHAKAEYLKQLWTKEYERIAAGAKTDREKVHMTIFKERIDKYIKGIENLVDKRDPGNRLVRARDEYEGRVVQNKVSMTLYRRALLNDADKLKRALDSFDRKDLSEVENDQLDKLQRNFNDFHSKYCNDEFLKQTYYLNKGPRRLKDARSVHMELMRQEHQINQFLHPKNKAIQTPGAALVAEYGDLQRNASGMSAPSNGPSSSGFGLYQIKQDTRVKFNGPIDLKSYQEFAAKSIEHIQTQLKVAETDNTSYYKNVKFEGSGKPDPMNHTLLIEEAGKNPEKISRTHNGKDTAIITMSNPPTEKCIKILFDTNAGLPVLSLKGCSGVANKDTLVKLVQGALLANRPFPGAFELSEEDTKILEEQPAYKNMKDKGLLDCQKYQEYVKAQGGYQKGKPEITFTSSGDAPKPSDESQTAGTKMKK